MAITKAIGLYGKGLFEIRELERCNSQVELNQAEQRWIKELGTLAPCGYNLTTGGSANGHMSEETKAKISIANKGKVVSLETRVKLSKSHKGWKPTEETKNKWRIAFGGKAPNIATRIGASTKSAKTYHLHNPKGECVTIVNLRIYCNKNGLSYTSMNSMANGRKPYKGWGVCQCFNCGGEGSNELGKLLMRIRDEEKQEGSLPT